MAGSTSELIKEKLDIAEVLRGYITLVPAGKNFKALCPFHKEKTPSFMVSPDRQSWHCFGCGIGGDIFAFVMRYENIEFGEALKILAEKAGVELKRLNPAEYKYLGLLYDLNDRAREYFKNQLSLSEEASSYLKERGISGSTVSEFEIGWAPNESDGLAKKMLSEGVNPEDILRAGLCVKTERGTILDRFRGRIMFPIHNHLGKTVGFTGRILPVLDRGDMGKYINSPETAIFNKSRILYGLNKAKNHIREAGRVFLVEGQMDMIMSWQAGIKYAVASSGTAFTADHMRLLGRMTEEIFVCFDNDSAGMDAGEKVIDLAEENDFRVKVVRLLGVKDPAEAAVKNPAALSEAITRAMPAMEFYFENHLEKGRSDLRSPGALKGIRTVLRKIKKIASPAEKGFWLKELSKRSGLEENALKEEAAKIDAADSAKTSGDTSDKSGDATNAVLQTRNISRKDLLSEKLLSHSWSSGNFEAAKSLKDMMSSSRAKITEILSEGKKSSEDPGLDEIINRIVLTAESLKNEEVEKIKEDLKSEHIKERRRELTVIIKRAEEDGDAVLLEETLKILGELPSL